MPTYFTAYSTKHQAMILALCLLLNGFITVGCLFAPKVYALLVVDESNIKFSTAGINITKVTIQSSTSQGTSESANVK